MTQDATGTAADIATLEDAMPQRGLRLLGTMGNTQSPEALLLIGDDVTRVIPGDEVGRLEVVAIEPGRVILDDGGESRLLTLPGSG